MQFCLLRSHVAIVTVECAHSSLGTAVQRGGLRVRNLHTSLLRRRQFLDEALGGACARLR